MEEYFLIGFIIVGLSITLIGTILWYRMVKRNKPLPELVKELKEGDNDDNIPSPPMEIG